GVESLAPNNHLSVLITVESKSKSSHKASPDDLIFEYRSAHGWRKMLVVSDGTEGFQRSGEIRLSIPTDIVKGGINLPESFYWLRCGQSVYSKIDTNFLSTQALPLIRVESGQEQQEPIHAGAIAQLTASIPGIKTFLQPLPVSGGRPVPTDQQHFGAVSGRLSHKRRAITLSDIETILLDEFPALYKVTVLPLSYAQPADKGLVKVIVTPYTNFQQGDCYNPIASHELMLNVFDFLQNIGLPSVRYEVSNPDFIELKVSCQVQFKQSNQEQALANQLIQELNQLMSPWIKGNKTSYAATEKLSGSMLYSFIQSRSYVSKIEDFAFYLFGSSEQATQDVIIVAPSAFIIPDQHHSIYCGSPNASLEEDEGLRIGETYYVNP
ncbi:MAG: hypothetical protein HOP30_22155, partial [Cyclobacteriaceae bacterium]|nr:hypothetical protein [Cyclobacteriaceae bacterium]